MAHPAAEPRIHFIPTRIGMAPQVDKATTAARLPVEIRSPGKLRRTRCDSHDIVAEIPRRFAFGGRAALIGVVTSGFGFREVGAIEMDAANAAAVIQLPLVTSRATSVEHRFDLGDRSRARRWEHRGGAMSRMGTGNRSHRFKIAIHDIRTAAAMNVDVNKSGANVTTTNGDRLC